MLKNLKKNKLKMRINKIYILLTVGVIMTTTLMANFSCLNTVQAASIAKSEIKYDAKDNSSVFPDSYKEYIRNLKKAHPNWIIKAFYTNQDWNTVINSESSGTYSRVQNSGFSDAWKRLESSGDPSYNAAGFVLASRQAVEYSIDPRNFLNDKGIFQFRVIEDGYEQDTKEAVNEAMTYTVMKDTEYKDTIYQVGNDKKISPLFIISRIKQETGCDIVNNGSINGKNSKHPGYYNFFNIGAYDDASHSVQYGINMAYSKGWDTPYKAIAGGIDWMKDHYIKYGQNTIYFQKFDVANPYGNATMILSSQYMSNISAPYSESKIMYLGLSRSNTVDKAYTFYIPIYNNMPDVASVYPGNYTNENKTILSTTSLNVRFEPNTDASVIATVNAGTKMTRLKKSNDTQWDMVKLANGQTGYVFRSYVRDYIMADNISLDKSELTLNVGNTYTFNPTITPTNAENKDVEWSTSDKNIVEVNNGTITAKSGGKATITAKLKESGKTATCTVNVLMKVESINLDKESYQIVNGGYLKIIPIIKPDGAANKDYTIKSDNEAVVKVEGKKLKAVSVGETNVTFTTVDQGKTATAKIKVIELPKDEGMSFDESIKVQEGKLTNISLETTAKEIVEKTTINGKYSVVVLDKDGKKLDDGSVLTTASMVSLVSADNVIMTYEVVIPGDVNGDGKMNAGDYVKIRNHLMDSTKLTDIFLDAADYDFNSTISAGDYVKIRNYIMTH